MNSDICFGILIKRYKRFLADIVLDDSQEIITAHCPNSGKLLGVPDNARVLLKKHPPSPSRKLLYTWEAFLDHDIWVGVNTHAANKNVEHFLKTRQLPLFQDYSIVKREVKYGSNARVDFVLYRDEDHFHEPLYLEVKSVHMKRHSVAVFPDCPTIRGVKHLKELQKLNEKGIQTAVLYYVQRSDCNSFSLAADLDPLYAASAIEARRSGVAMWAFSAHITPDNPPLLNPTPLTFNE